MTPTGVLTKHLDLVSHLEDYRFRQIVNSCFRLGWESTNTGPEGARVAENLTAVFGQGVRAAADYYVTADMVQLLLHAADGLDEEDHTDVTLVPTPCGFVVFEKPIELLDVRGRVLKAHYLTWNASDTGVLITWWNDAQDPDEVEEAFLEGVSADFARENLGDWRWIGGDVVPTGRTLGAKIIPLTEHQRELVLAEGDVPTEGTNMVRVAHALWLMLGQTITKVSEEKTERAVARRAMRKNLPGSVTVVQLRRVEHKGGVKGETDVQWKHRWIVRGHWRWTHCGEKHRLAQWVNGEWRARVWISPFVKGPEDAELVVSKKVYSLSR